MRSISSPTPTWSKIPESVTNLEAAFVEPLGVALHAVRLSHLRLGDQALIIGAGPIGLLTQQCAALSGASRVFVSEVNAARKAVASALGADAIFDPNQGDVVEETLRHTGIGVDVALECAGAPATFQEAIQAVRGAGRVIIQSFSRGLCMRASTSGRSLTSAPGNSAPLPRSPR